MEQKSSENVCLKNLIFINMDKFYFFQNKTNTLGNEMEEKIKYVHFML